MAEEKLNLYEKLAKIRKMTEVIQKNKKGFNYKYTSIDEILARVTAGMDKYGVSLIPTFVPETEEVTPNIYNKVKYDKAGNKIEETVVENTAKARMEYKWINNEKPEEVIIVPWFIVGSQTDPAQALGSGMTYGLRQFLTQYFQIATPENDVDYWRTIQQETEGREEVEAAEAIIENVHKLVSGHLESAPDSRKEILDIVRKYTKEANGKATANYYDIKTPDVATKLLEEVKKFIEPKQTTKKAKEEK